MNWLLFIIIFIVACIILYLIAIMPRMLKRPDKTAFDGVFFAHRGLFNNTSHVPENSILAFKRAVEHGFGIEMDVQLTKDKVPVVFHDFTLQRACGTSGKVEDYTYEELQKLTLFGSGERIPKFEEVLRVVDGKVPLIIELKIEWLDYSVCKIADKILQRYKGKYAIESFNPLGLLWYRKHRNDVVRGQLSDHFRKEGTAKGYLYFLLHYLTLNFLTKPDFIAYNHKYHKNLSRCLCRHLYKAKAAAWTIKSEDQLKQAKQNFDWIIFDGFVPQKYLQNS